MKFRKQIFSVVAFAFLVVLGGAALAAEMCTLLLERTGQTISGGSYKSYSFTKTAGRTYYACVYPSSGNPNLYGDYRGYPTTSSYQYRSANRGTSSDCISFPATTTGTYYLRVYNGSSTDSAGYYLQVWYWTTSIT